MFDQVLAGAGILYQQMFHERYKTLETCFYMFLGAAPSVAVLAHIQQVSKKSFTLFHSCSMATSKTPSLSKQLYKSSFIDGGFALQRILVAWEIRFFTSSWTVM